MTPIRLVTVTLVLLGTACGASSAPGDTAADGPGDTAADGPGDTAADGSGDTPGNEAAPNADEPTTDQASDWPHDFRGTLLSGGQFDANDLAGRDIVLWFWAPW